MLIAHLKEVYLNHSQSEISRERCSKSDEYRLRLLDPNSVVCSAAKSYPKGRKTKMRTRNSVLLLAVATAVLTLFTYKEASAVANGDGICSAAEAAVFDCGTFNANVIEFVGASNATCVLANFPSGTSCTAYFYRYTGSSTNQVNVGIPKDVQKKFTAADASPAGCSQLLTNNSGDPTTGFLKNDGTQNVCRIANNLSSLPANLNPPAPGTANFFIAADPSFADERPWQVRQSKTEVFADTVNGPASAQAPVAESGASLTTTEGSTCTYEILGGVPSLTNCPTGSVVPINQTKLCILNTGGPVTFTNAQGNWTCETISFVSDQCDVKTTGSDPCRYIGGFCLKY